MAKKKDNYTIDDLAIAVAKGFDEANEKMDKKFDQIDQRFDGVDKRLDHIENELKVTRVELSFGLREIKEEIKRLDERIDKISKTTVLDINELVEKVAVCESDISKLKQKIAKLKLAN